MPDDDADDLTVTNHPDGSYEWADQSGSHGSVTRAGATVENPDGSTTAIDTKGNEAHWDAQGNYSDSQGGQQSASPSTTPTATQTTQGGQPSGDSDGADGDDGSSDQGADADSGDDDSSAGDDGNSGESSDDDGSDSGDDAGDASDGDSSSSDDVA